MHCFNCLLVRTSVLTIAAIHGSEWVFRNYNSVFKHELKIWLVYYRVCFLFKIVEVAIEYFHKQLHLNGAVHALIGDSNSFLQTLCDSLAVSTLKKKQKTLFQKPQIRIMVTITRNKSWLLNQESYCNGSYPGFIRIKWTRIVLERDKYPYLSPVSFAAFSRPEQVWTHHNCSALIRFLEQFGGS